MKTGYKPTYEALLLSYHGVEELDPSKGGFKTEQEAIDYVCTHNCKDCVDEGFGSACAAEWMVIEEELLTNK